MNIRRGEAFEELGERLYSIWIVQKGMLEKGPVHLN
jgi:hypothetical protein